MPMSPQARRRLRPRSRAKAPWARRAGGLTFFCVDLLENRVVQRGLGQHLLEPAVFQLQRLEPIDVGNLKLTEVLALGVDRGLADLAFLGRLGHRGAAPSRRIATICSAVNRLLLMGLGGCTTKNGAH